MSWPSRTSPTPPCSSSSPATSSKAASRTGRSHSTCSCRRNRAGWSLGSFCVEAGRWRQRGAEAIGHVPIMPRPDHRQGPESRRRRRTRPKSRARSGRKSARRSKSWRATSAVRSPPPRRRPACSCRSKTSMSKTNWPHMKRPWPHAADGKSDVIGMALCINGKVEGAEVYGSAALFQKLWPKLLKSAATDALAQLDDKKKFEPATAKAVETFLTEAAAGPAKEVQMAGVKRATAGRQNAGMNARDAAVPGSANARRHARPPVQGPPARVRIVRYDGGQGAAGRKPGQGQRQLRPCCIGAILRSEKYGEPGAGGVSRRSPRHGRARGRILRPESRTKRCHTVWRKGFVRDFEARALTARHYVKLEKIIPGIRYVAAHEFL